MTEGDHPDPLQLDEAIQDWRVLLAEHSEHLVAYEKALREADRNLTDPSVLEATRMLRSSITSLAHAQPRDPATGLIDWREAARPDFSLGWMPVWNEPDPPPSASLFELPGVVVLDDLIAEGEWGSLRVAEALVFSDSVDVVIERVQLRDSQDLQTWQARDQPLDSWREGEGDPPPMHVVGPANPVAVFHGGFRVNAYRGARKEEVCYRIVGPFAAGILHCTLPALDPDVGVIEFDLDAGDLIEARRLGWTRP
jgi:hypothetical protein